MLQIAKLLCAFGALSLLPAPAVAAEKLAVPAWLKAKREGKVSQATPSPLSMIFTPIAPCRAFSQQGLAAGQAKTFRITGSSSFASQNGPTTGCGVPAYAKAVAINLSAAASSAAPAVTLYAAGTPRPGTPNLYAPTSGSYSMSSAIVPLSGAGQVTAHANKGARIYGDVTGYFEPQLWAYIHENGSIIDSSGRVVSSTLLESNTYAVQFNRDISSCVAVATSDLNPYTMTVSTNGSFAYVDNFNTNWTYMTNYFNLIVKC